MLEWDLHYPIGEIDVYAATPHFGASVVHSRIDTFNNLHAFLRRRTISHERVTKYGLESSNNMTKNWGICPFY